MRVYLVLSSHKSVSCKTKRKEKKGKEKKGKERNYIVYIPEENSNAVFFLTCFAILVYIRKTVVATGNSSSTSMHRLNTQCVMSM